MTTDTTLTPNPIPDLAPLYHKISQAIGLLNQGLSKDGYNPHHKYRFMEAEEVKRAVGAALATVGLALKVSLVRFERTELKPVNQKDADLLTCWYEISLLDSFTGQRETSQWASQVTIYGHDDKALNKAATSAVKYFLLSTFLIPDEDERANDTDRAGEERATQRPTLTNGHGEARSLPQSQDTAPKKQAPKWLDGVKKRYTDKHGDTGLDVFMDKARDLWAEGKLNFDTPESTAFALVSSALEADENAKLIGPDDGMPVSWGPALKAVARHFDGDMEEAKTFIRGQLKANAVTPKMTAEAVKAKLIGIMTKMADLPALEDTSDPFADLMSKAN
jgi:hypothetical protein